jgi:hypothetical protein
MRKLLFILVLMPFFVSAQQETIKVMHYNLLNYGNVTSYCTNQNNNIQDKDDALKEIISHVNPHIFTVNEVGSSNFAQERVLNSVLNTQGRTWYEMAAIVNASGGTIDNMLYYDRRMFGLADQDVVSTSVRDFDIYKLFFKAKDLSTTQDTAFLTCIVTHLKAGSSSSDQQLRASMTAALMSHMENNMSAGEYLLMGDFNVKTSSEQAYQNLVNYSNTNYRFYDPVNTPGSWNNSSSYADLHTQSTHYSSNGCASGGGMDDRFDFILISGDIDNQNGHYHYENGTYKALGNDGQHFNDAINYNGNSSVPAAVLSALYNMSDHLPVVMNLIVDQEVGVDESVNPMQVIVKNPVNNNISVSVSSAHMLEQINLYSMMGQRLMDKSVDGRDIILDVSSLSEGIYILEMISRNNQLLRTKIIKN